MNFSHSLFGKKLCAAIFVLASGLAIAFSRPTEVNSVKAVVNNEPITGVMLDQAMNTQVQLWLMENNGRVSRSAAEREIRELEERALDDLIDRMLILDEFERLGGKIKSHHIDEAVDRFIKMRFKGDREAFLAELKKTGMTIAQFRDVQQDQIAINALREQNSGDDVIPNTPWEKKREYEEIKDKFASEGRPKLRMMSIPKQTDTSSPDQQKAILDKVRAELRSGADFGALAKQYSADSFASKGGYVGVLDRNTLNAGLTQAAYNIPSGQMSPPLDDGPFWRILKVDGRVGQSVPSYKELEEEVDKRLTIKKKQKNLDTWLKKLRRDANVRIFED